MPLRGPVTRPTPGSWSATTLPPIDSDLVFNRLDILANARVVRLDHLWSCGSGDLVCAGVPGRTPSAMPLAPSRAARGVRKMGRWWSRRIRNRAIWHRWRAFPHDGFSDEHHHGCRLRNRVACECPAAARLAKVGFPERIVGLIDDTHAGSGVVAVGGN